ncbi:hypothetical protein [Rufibacter quisquiliarum]|uniref:Uncharacterized protein n=1 Tax=Rufibacter quisquiliarum TaxID=1549639 RepID=A0A839GI95_9BACT|nr:hypothetical protein [Rufibacter quisquiliarum]MBA9076439.1 hypothetical protein [Rufibacter quisquiliarum]
MNSVPVFGLFFKKQVENRNVSFVFLRLFLLKMSLSIQVLPPPKAGEPIKEIVELPLRALLPLPDCTNATAPYRLRYKGGGLLLKPVPFMQDEELWFCTGRGRSVSGLFLGKQAKNRKAFQPSVWVIAIA